MTYEGIDDDNSQVINAVLELPDGDFNVSITGVHDWNGSGNLNLSITDPSDDSVIFTTSAIQEIRVSNGIPKSRFGTTILSLIAVCPMMLVGFVVVTTQLASTNVVCPMVTIRHVRIAQAFQMAHIG